jgi:DNA-binding NtrC family response regulator
MSESTNPNDYIEHLRAQIQSIGDRVSSWPQQSVDGLAAGWSPLLMEQLKRIEMLLSKIPKRLSPPIQTPPLVSGSLAGMTMAQIEMLAIEETLLFTGGNRAKAAKLLEIGARTLYIKLTDSPGAEASTDSCRLADQEDADDERSLADAIAQTERATISSAYRRNARNKFQTAKSLQVSRSTLDTKLREYCIE